MSGTLMFCGLVALALGSIWFITSSMTTVFGEGCVPGRIKPSKVCPDEGGKALTYAEARAAEEHGVQGMKTGGTVVAVGAGLIVIGFVARGRR